MIRLEGISKRFGPVEALRSVDLEVRRGEWLGLFGHNGSGKTTLIRILVGLSQPSAGRLLIEGREPDREGWRAFRRRLGFMPERISFYEHLTGEETLRYFARLRGAGGERVMQALEGVGLGGAARRRVGEYSKGMQQRLNLAQALIGGPEVLVVDEPIEGLDPEGTREFFRLLRSGEGRTVVLSSHRLSEACGQVDRACVLSRGEVRALGGVEELSRALRLPIRVHLYPAGSVNGALEAALRRLGAVSVLKGDGRLVAEVPQSEKIGFLTGLDAFRGEIRYLRVEEPSLEEVYFAAD